MSEIVRCERCGRPCRSAGTGNPDARLLRHAERGYCANCGLTEFLKKTSPLCELLELQGARVLLTPHIQTGILRLLPSGQADATTGEIDFSTIVENWSLPLAGKQRKRRGS